MPKIVIIGNTLIDLNNIYDKSNKIYFVANRPYDLDYPENIELVMDQNVLDFYKSENLEDDEDHITFIDCTGFSKNPYDVMYMLQTGRLENRSYYIGDKTLKFSDYPSIKHYNIFQGEKMSSTINKKDKTVIKSMMKNYSKIIEEYLKAGFHERKINSIPPGWTLNLATKEISLLAHYYRLFPSAPDYNPYEKNITFPMNPIICYLHNSQYRQVVLDTMIAVVANFLVRNEYLSSTNIDDWYDVKTWSLAQKKL